MLEGINGCGKGTQLDYLQNFIYNLSKSQTIFMTREPNEFDENGKKAREILKSDGDPYSNRIEAVRYFAENRRTHNQIIKPLLDKGVTVISDRYWHSNFAFQGAQGIHLKDIAEANHGLIVPDLTIIFDISAKTANKRLENRDGENRRKFDKNTSFMEDVSSCYKILGLKLPYLINDESIRYIECETNYGEKPKEVVRHEMLSLVERLYK